MVTMVWIVSRPRLKGPSWYLIFMYISPLTSLGQHSHASWVLQPQNSATLLPQPGGKTMKFIGTGGGIGERASRYISIVKPTRCTASQIYFILDQHSTCFGQSFVHHQESKTVHTASSIHHTGSANCLLAGTRWNSTCFRRSFRPSSGV